MFDMKSTQLHEQADTKIFAKLREIWQQNLHEYALFEPLISIIFLPLLQRDNIGVSKSKLCILKGNFVSFHLQ